MNIKIKIFIPIFVIFISQPKQLYSMESFQSEQKYSEAYRAVAALYGKSGKEEVNNNVIQNVYGLSVDGGGIRGVIPAQVLTHLQRAIEIRLKERIRKKIEEHLGYKLSPDVDIPIKGHLAKLFNLMAGTSTGGIIVIGLNKPADNLYPQYSTEDLVKLYADNGKKVFPQAEQRGYLGSLFVGEKYDSSGLQQILKSYFGENLTLKDTISRVLVTTYEMRQEEPFCFDTDKARESNANNFRLCDAGLATGAAQTYYKPANVQNINKEEHLFADGGTVANNPAMLAWTRANKLFPNAASITLLSLGTGQCRAEKLATMNQSQLSWAGTFPSVTLDGTSKIVDSMLQEWSKVNGVGRPKFNYIRIQPDLSNQRKEMDDVTDENIKYLKAIADACAKKHDKDLSDLADKLVDVFEKNPYPVRYDLLTNFEQNVLSEVCLVKVNFNVIAAFEVAYYLKQLTKQKLENITRLNLALNAIDDNILRILATALPTSLKKVNLNVNRLTAQGIEYMCNLKNLEKLSVCCNPLGDSGAKTIAKIFPHLTTLDVSSIQMTNDGLECLVSRLQKLKKLHIGNLSQMSPIENSFFLKNAGHLLVQSLPCLKQLSLQGIKSSDTIIGIVDALENNSTLEYLELANIGPLSFQQWDKISKILSTTKLKQLNLANNNIDSIFAITDLLKSSDLVSVDVNLNHLNPFDCINSFAYSSSNPRRIKLKFDRQHYAGKKHSLLERSLGRMFGLH